MMKLRTVVAPVAATMVLALSACGGSSKASNGVASLNGRGATTTTSKVTVKQYQDAMLKYAGCIRKNGFPSFPDPQFDAKGQTIFRGDRPGGTPTGAATPSTAQQFDRRDPKFQAARDKCDSIRQPVQGLFAPTAAQRAENQKAQLKFAKCMRDKGFNVPDPQFDVNGRRIFNDANRTNFQKLRDDPKAQAAFTDCQKAAGSSFFGGGRGGGGGGGGFGPGGGRGGGPGDGGGPPSGATPTTKAGA